MQCSRMDPREKYTAIRGAELRKLELLPLLAAHLPLAPNLPPVEETVTMGPERMSQVTFALLDLTSPSDPVILLALSSLTH